MKLCAECTFPIARLPDGTWSHPWDCSDLTDLWSPRERRPESADVTSGWSSAPVRVAGSTIACPVTGGGLADPGPADRWQNRPSFPQRLFPAILDDRSDIAPIAWRCLECDSELVVAVFDQFSGGGRPRVGVTSQGLVVACTCGAAAAIVPLASLAAYADALELALGDVAGRVGVTLVQAEPDDDVADHVDSVMFDWDVALDRACPLCQQGASRGLWAEYGEVDDDGWPTDEP